MGASADLMIIRPATRRGMIIGAHPGRPGANAARAASAPHGAVDLESRGLSPETAPEAWTAGATPSGPLGPCADNAHYVNSSGEGLLIAPSPGCRVAADARSDRRPPFDPERRRGSEPAEPAGDNAPM